MCISPLRIPRPERRAKPVDPTLVDCENVFIDPRPELDPVRVVDHQFPWNIVPCGRCIECLNARKSQWYVRLRRQIELGRYSQVYWVSLTFSDLELPETMEILSQKMRRWKDVLRKRYNKIPDHWFITERGEDDKHSKRLHLHGFLMFKDVRPRYEEVKSTWKYGFMWIQELKSLSAVTYSMKYVFKNAKRKLEGDNLVSKIFTSKGIGSAQLTKSSYRFMFGVDNEYVPTESFGTAYEYTLPRYIRLKVEKLHGYRPEITPLALLKQILGVRLFSKPLAVLIKERQRQISRAFRSKQSFSNKFMNVAREVERLLMWYPELYQQIN